MAQICIVYFIARDGTETECQAVKLRFYKDCYAAATELSGSVLFDGDPSEITEIALYAGGRILHRGYAEYLKVTNRHGRRLASFRSHGWSIMLTQNEPVPGMNFNVNLTSLAAMNVSIPNVTYETGTASVNYIYVKERSTVWDAVSAYARKAYGTQPYISRDNCVCVRALQGTSRTYSGELLVSAGEVHDRRTMLSKVYMADADGNYSYSEINPDAAVDGIVREKYYPLDRQWLSSPSQGLQMRIDQCDRRHSMEFVTLLGYSGEELFDTFSVMSDSCTWSGTVGGIEVIFEQGRAVCTLYKMND